MLETLIFKIPGLLVAFVVHEVGHGAVAYALGDPTPKRMGRLSFNPVRHIDPVGFLMLWVVGFGWAKPVEVNPHNFADPRRGMVMVALAGPMMNFILAFVALALLHALDLSRGSLAATMLIYAAQLNVGLGVFNLLPIPPLDGSRVLAGLLPHRSAAWFETAETYGWLILVLLLATGIVGRILWPLVSFTLNFLNVLARTVFDRGPAGGALF